MSAVDESPATNGSALAREEAAKTVAQHLIDMRDKTGKHGLLCSTGGGGNPQFFSPPRFRNFWGAGNVFEPGCAQCYLPRNYTMPLINGLSDTSIADSGCPELYKPAKYGGIAEVYVHDGAPARRGIRRRRPAAAWRNSVRTVARPSSSTRASMPMRRRRTCGCPSNLVPTWP